jgi:aspartate carbamoyltransferase catalytic subunit
MPKVPTLRGKVVATLFFEESTRTRLSFETAAKRLSADVLSWPWPARRSRRASRCATPSRRSRPWASTPSSSATPSGAPHQVARWATRARVINAGDGWHEHPTQALLDCFTVRQVLAERKGAAPEELGIDCFEGLRVLIVGDIRHSRVARSEVLAYTALGARSPWPRRAASCRPRSRAGRSRWPRPRRRPGRRRRGLLLRLQAERGSGSFVPSLREYTAGWGLTAAGPAAGATTPSSRTPGPMVRGVEIASDVADLPRTVVTQQVTNGVAVRMAILFLLLGGEWPAAGCRPWLR